MAVSYNVINLNSLLSKGVTQIKQVTICFVMAARTGRKHEYTRKTRS